MTPAILVIVTNPGLHIDSSGRKLVLEESIHDIWMENQAVQSDEMDSS